MQIKLGLVLFALLTDDERPVHEFSREQKPQVNFLDQITSEQ